MTEDQRRQMFDGSKLTIYRGAPPGRSEFASGEIIAQFEFLALPDGSWVTLKDGEIFVESAP